MNSSRCPPKRVRSKKKRKKEKANVKRNLQIQTHTIYQNPHYIPQNYLIPPYQLGLTTLKTTSPFCHDEQRMNYCEVVTSS